MTATLHPHRWMPREGRFYDVAIAGRPVGTVGRWTGERGWWWQHAKDKPDARGPVPHPLVGRPYGCSSRTIGGLNGGNER